MDRLQIARERMLSIRHELDEMAIHRSNLHWEYMELNKEIGRLEWALAREKAADKIKGE